MATDGKNRGPGRPKGAVGKIHDDARSKALASGLSPLDYLLSVMRNEATDEKTRIDAAKAAAPYLHAKLVSSEINGNLNVDLTAEILSIVRKGNGSTG